MVEERFQYEPYGSDQSVELKVSPASTPKRGWRFYGAFGTLCLVTFVIALDSTIICVALPVSWDFSIEIWSPSFVFQRY